MTTNKLNIAITRAIVLTIAVMTITVMTGIAQVVPANAQVATTTNATRIVDGSLIRAHNDIDIYIVKIVGNKLFKRLILNPTIFESYGHLRWEDVLNVSPATLNQYRTSDLVREVYPDGSIVPPGKVYKLYPQGDTGIKRHLQITQAEFEANFDKDSIYGINATEASPTFYAEGAPLTAADLGVGTTTPTTPSTPPTPETPTSPGQPTSPDDEPRAPTQDVDGDEGELTADLTTQEVESEVGEGQEAVVLAVELEASGSDVEVLRVDVSFMGEDNNGNTAGGGDTRPWKTFDRVRLILDGQVIASRANLDNNDFVREGDGYRLRFPGLEEVIDEDDVMRLEVEVRVDSSLTSRRQNNDWTIGLLEDSIRGVDEANIQAYAGHGEDIEGSDLTDTFSIGDPAGAKLSAEKSGEDVDDRVRVSTSEDTDDIMVFNIDFENDEDAADATLQEVTIGFTSTLPSGAGNQPSGAWNEGTAAADQTIASFFDKVSLYLGDKELDSVDVEDDTTAATGNTFTVTFNNLDVDFDPDEIRTLMVKVNVNTLNAANEEAKVVPYLVGYFYEYGDDEEEQANPNPIPTSLDTTGTEGTAYVDMGDAITFTALSPVVMASSTPTLTRVESNLGEAKFTIQVSAPKDNSVYILNSCGTDSEGFSFLTNANAVTNANCIIDTITNAKEVGTSGTEELIEISAGETATFTFIIDVVGAGGRQRISLKQLQWDDAANAGKTALIDANNLSLTGLDMETPSLYLTST